MGCDQSQRNRELRRANQARRWLARQDQREHAADTELTADLDPTTVHLGQFARQRQAQPEAAVVRRRVSGLRERLENRSEIV